MSLVAEADEGWREGSSLPVADIRAAEPEFVLIGAHYCTWFSGHADNIKAANALLLELARLLAPRWPASCATACALAWWPGHTHGRYIRGPPGTRMPSGRRCMTVRSPISTSTSSAPRGAVTNCVRNQMGELAGFTLGPRVSLRRFSRRRAGEGSSIQRTQPQTKRSFTLRADAADPRLRSELLGGRPQLPAGQQLPGRGRSGPPAEQADSRGGGTPSRTLSTNMIHRNPGPRHRTARKDGAGPRRGRDPAARSRTNRRGRSCRTARVSRGRPGIERILSRWSGTPKFRRRRERVRERASRPLPHETEPLR